METYRRRRLGRGGRFVRHLGRSRGQIPSRIRSLVGALPIAMRNVPTWVFEELPDSWADCVAAATSADLADSLVSARAGGTITTTLSPLPSPRLRAVLRRMLDEGEFLGAHRVRSLSAAYRDGVTMGGRRHPDVDALRPGRGKHARLWGNSNWRGPIWFPSTPCSWTPRSHAAERTGSRRRVPPPAGRMGLDDLVERLDRPTSGSGGRTGARDTARSPERTSSGTCTPPSVSFDGDTGRGAARPTRPGGPRWWLTSSAREMPGTLEEQQRPAGR